MRADQAAASLPDDRRAAVLTDLAEAYIVDHELEPAESTISKARALAKFNGRIVSHDDAHIVFVEAMIEDARGDTRAETGYRQVANSTVAWSSMRLEAALKSARWLAAHKRADEAEAQFRAAEALLEDMRQSLDHDDSKLSFFADAGNIYNEYVDLLVSRHKDLEALQAADRSRARLLSDYQKVGLGGLDLAHLQSRLKTVDGIALSYWIGGEHSYLWIIGDHVFERVTLNAPPAAIRDWARTYFEATSSPAELPAAAIDAGKHLRETLLVPAQKYLTHDRRVFMVLDGQLGLLNPESLPGAQSRWWIDEAIVSAVPSLALLERPPDTLQPTSLLLAMGDADPSPGFPKLAQASAELGAITRLFPSALTREFAGSAATPSAYGHANPGQFQMIHFTAHGKAEAGNPLDSAVVLSKDPATQANKLYAREIVDIPIHARLVTVSACKSAGSRTYRGEGPVGLAWAFLRAGAGQVVAGLWNVNDEAGEDLMARFYEGMRTRNLPPAVALREAKRALIKTYKHPYYWAPFEIFAGYVEP
jgi:CHAT domain-containing protein